MKDLAVPISPGRWIVQICSAGSGAEGGIVRHKLGDVERLIGRERVPHEVRRRSFRAVENAGQFIIIFNRQPLRLLV